MSEHNHDCPDCGGYFACNRDDCDASVLCLECQVKELTAKLGKLATDNLKVQHDAAIENTRLRSELAKAREDAEKAREERNHVRVELQREENKEITHLTTENNRLDVVWQKANDDLLDARLKIVELTYELAKAREAIESAWAPYGGLLKEEGK